MFLLIYCLICLCQMREATSGCKSRFTLMKLCFHYKKKKLQKPVILGTFANINCKVNFLQAQFQDVAPNQCRDWTQNKSEVFDLLKEHLFSFLFLFQWFAATVIIVCMCFCKFSMFSFSPVWKDMNIMTDT